MIKALILGLLLVSLTNSAGAEVLTKNIQVQCSMQSPVKTGQIKFDDDMTNWNVNTMDPEQNCYGYLSLPVTVSFDQFKYSGDIEAEVHGTKVTDASGNSFCKVDNVSDVPDFMNHVEFIGTLVNPQTGGYLDLGLISIAGSDPIRFSGGTLSGGASQCEFLIVY